RDVRGRSPVRSRRYVPISRILRLIRKPLEIEIERLVLVGRRIEVELIARRKQHQWAAPRSSAADRLRVVCHVPVDGVEIGELNVSEMKHSVPDLVASEIVVSERRSSQLDVPVK